MELNWLIINGIGAFLVFMIYNYMIFDFADTILCNPKLKSTHRLLIGILNSAVLILFMVIHITTVKVNLLMLFLLSAEFCIFYKDKISRIIFVVCVYMVHIMALRMICVACYSAFSGVSYYDVVNQPLSLVRTTLICFFVLCIMLALVKKFIPAEKIRILNQHNDQFWFMALWTIVCMAALILNSRLYSVNEVYSPLNLIQIVMAVTVLATEYIVLFFCFRTSALLGYKQINSRLEQKIYKERQYRDCLISDAISTYEFNLTNDEIESEIEEGLPKSLAKYKVLMANKVVHPDDVLSYLQFFESEKLIHEFQMGRKELYFEYRRLNEQNEYIWVRSTINLVKDQNSQDIKGFIYVKNINQEKMMQLDLKFKAERDPLTSLYNKVVTAKKISEQLQIGVANATTGALLILDVDNFKMVNDNLGHTFGDAVLCELAEKLKAIFRENDVIGRIGGDEFIVYMTNLKNLSVIKTKALDICNHFCICYQGTEGTEICISASVGIAIYPMHGSTFETLYKNADIALYSSKNRSKNTFTIYDGEEFTKYKSNRTEIDSINSVLQKGFRHNRIEYIFKILYGSENPLFAVQSVLELLGKHFGFSRGYIFQTSDDALYCRNTYEWCNIGITPQIQNLHKVPIADITTAMYAFQTSGMNVVRNINELPENERRILEPQGIISMLQFAIFEKTRFIGCIGFDDCTGEHPLTEGEIDEISTICSVLSTFLVKQLVVEKAQHNLLLLSNVLDKMETFLYVIKDDTYELLFMNQLIYDMLPNVQIGMHCYEALRGRPSPCADCPMRELSDDPNAQNTKVLQDTLLGRPLALTCSRISWVEGRTACLLNGMLC